MNNTRAQQKALDDELVAPADRRKIGKSNLRLSLIIKSKEPTLQVALDALKLTPFYNAFAISADLNGKSHTVNIDNFRDILKIFLKLPGQIFEEPPLEEEILSFIRDLRHTGEIKFLSDVNVNHMHQPWRSFVAIINKCLSRNTTALENLVYQVENKNSKKNNDMYYPRFTKVIADYFMAMDQAIPRRNKMFWHYARDDFMFTTIRVISKHQDTQVYGAILPQHLTNQAMLESEAYMTYHAYATGEKTPIPKSTKKKADSESFTKDESLLKTSKGKENHYHSKAEITCQDRSNFEEDDDDEINVSEDDDDDNEDDDDNDDDGNNDDDDDVDNQDDDDEQTDSDNNNNDEEIQDANVEGDKMNEEETNEEAEVDALYKDVNVNLEGRNYEMTDAPRTIVQILITEFARDVYSKCRIIAVTKLEIVDWHNYKHLDWITVRKDDDKLYKFKKGDLNRLLIQDIEDMLLFLVQDKLTNLPLRTP
ncbi:hypothetical protein Tco_1121335 [Tanacetum coccineum]|uniref:Uncharacterized protein n=1 Tax=Tanacetum coccineum TaxID=301880 RepID=A0ABQ5IXD7_9ASTR